MGSQTPSLKVAKAKGTTAEWYESKLLKANYDSLDLVVTCRHLDEFEVAAGKPIFTPGSRSLKF